MRTGIAVDIRGVLQRYDAPVAELSRGAVERLNRIVEETGAAVVISSGLRALPEATAMGYVPIQLRRWSVRAWLEAWLRSYGFRHRIDGVTPCLLSRDRGDEVDVAMGDRGIHHWLALDDEKRLFRSQWHDRLVCTERDGILTEAHADEVVRRLRPAIRRAA